MGLLHQLRFVAYSFLPQAGDGGEYLEGYKDPYHVCFKCGKPGHWAQNCTGFLPDGQVSHVLFGSTHLCPFRVPMHSPMRFPSSPSCVIPLLFVPFLLPLLCPAPLALSLSPSPMPSPFPLPCSLPLPRPCLCLCLRVFVCLSLLI